MKPNPSSRAKVEPSDEVLWTAVKAGDEASFASFYRRHRQHALSVSRRICGDAAEDAVQAAFLSIWRNRASYSADRGRASSWLMAAVRNRSIDVVRMKNRRQREVLGVEGLIEAEDPLRTEDVAFGRATAQSLRAAIAELPIRERQVVELGYIGELSQSEIAYTLGLPLGTVKGRSRAALQRLATVAV